MNNNRVLVVDLDGTLLKTDLLYESLLVLLKSNFFSIIYMIRWLLKGKAYFKHQIAKRINIDVATLPYNNNVIEYVNERRANGCKTCLCTASNNKFAYAIASQLKIFDDCIASDEYTNVSGQKKSEVLVKKYGYKCYDYIGNSLADIPVWETAKIAHICTNKQSLINRVKKPFDEVNIFITKKQTLRTYLKALRVHQWMKNILIFLPVIAAHELSNWSDFYNIILAFFAFSFAASSVYVLNDLMDLPNDRVHSTKHKRPFAAGLVEIKTGLILIPALLAISCAISIFLPNTFGAFLLVYYIITIAYTFNLKSIAILDCFVLSTLYTIRIFAGGAALNISISFWLLSFSIFLFLSLAFLKRYSELKPTNGDPDIKIIGRGYFPSDIILVITSGVASGHIATLVFALYINSDSIIKLYATPELIWLNVFILLYWLTWMWQKANRCEINEDPVVFAAKHPTSIAVGILFIVIACLGAIVKL